VVPPALPTQRELKSFVRGRQDKAVEMLSLQIVVFQAIRDGADAKLPEGFQHFLNLTTKVAQTVTQMQC